MAYNPQEQQALHAKINRMREISEEQQRNTVLRALYSPGCDCLILAVCPCCVVPCPCQTISLRCHAFGVRFRSSAGWFAPPTVIPASRARWSCCSKSHTRQRVLVWIPEVREQYEARNAGARSRRHSCCCLHCSRATWSRSNGIKRCSAWTCACKLTWWNQWERRPSRCRWTCMPLHPQLLRTRRGAPSLSLLPLR